MPVMLKLMGLYLFNLAGLCGLVALKLQSGGTFPEALKAVWEAVLTGTRKDFSSGRLSSDLAAVLAKTWWMTLFMTLLLWCAKPDQGYGYAVIGLGLFHLGWYWWSRVFIARDPERTETLDSRWGTIHMTVRENSFFHAKSLAELDLRKKNLLILAIVREGNIVPFPKGIEVLAPGDRLIIFGDLDYYRGIQS